MNISIFDVTGPVMIGPSSSHTAGAARLARMAGLIAASPYTHVSFGLHGSFAKTYKGHGTGEALVAGALGLKEDDERLADAFAIAAERDLGYDFYETELDGMHENSVKMTFTLQNGKAVEVTGSSLGGGRIVIRNIGGFEVEFTAQASTLFLIQKDQKGIVSEVTRVLAECGLNIGVMRLSRRAKGDLACCVIEVDGVIPDRVVRRIEEVPNVLSAQAINIGEEG